MEESKQFRIRESISEGFELFKKEPVYYIGYLLLTIGITAILGLIPVIGQVGNIIIGGALGIGPAVLSHKLKNEEEYTFNNMFDGFSKLGNFVIYSIIFGVVAIILALIFGGTALLPILLSGGNVADNPEVIMGMVGSFGILFLIFMVMYLFVMYTPFFIMFKNMDVMASISASFKLVKNNILKNFLLVLTLGLVVIAGILCFGVGLFVAIPVAQAALYLVFRKQVLTDDLKKNDLFEHLI